MLKSDEIRSMLQRGQVAEARDVCRAAVEEGGHDAEAWFLLAACEQRMQAPAAARATLEKAARATDDTTLLQQVADALIKLRAFETAAAVIDRLDFSRPQSVLLQARCRWGLGQHEAALEQLATLWKFVPGWTTLAVSLARMLINLDQHAEALRVVEQALSGQPGEAQLVHQKALLLISAEGVDAAAAWLGTQPHGHPSLNMLVDALDRVRTAGRSGSAHPGPNWEGLEYMTERADATHWFGDNVALLSSALARAPVQGAIVECGVYHGRTVNLLAKWAPDRRVFGFDSFEGLPQDWTGRESAGSYSTGGRLPEVRENVELVKGWFDRTLPAFAARLEQQAESTIALLHIDCDIYSSTLEALTALGPRLAPGAVVVFDEYTGYAGWRDHEARAWDEFRARGDTRSRLCLAQLLGQSAAFEIAGPSA